MAFIAFSEAGSRKKEILAMASMRKEQSNIIDIVTTDQTRFFLSPGKWEEFCDLLEKPPRSIPELRKLFQEECVWSDKGKDGN